MAQKRYEKTFSRVDAPYMQAVRLSYCDDVSKMRTTVRRVELSSDCANIDQLSRFTQLERLHCELRKDWLEQLSLLPNLKYVEFTLPQTDKIPSLKCLARLRTLVLRSNHRQTNLNFLRGMTSLRSLCVSEALGVEQLNPISTLTDLQELYIDGSTHRRHKIRTLAPLAKLHDLRFAVLLVGSAQQNRPLRHLLQLRNLEYLYLDASYLNPDELDQVVEQLPRVKKIEFNGGLTWPRKA